jgi:Protein of unknown function (DUF3667)
MKFKFLTANEPPFDDTLERTCKNCDHVFHGRYCNRCGEKVVEKYERSIRFFIDSVFNAFTFLEGKFWRTLKIVLTQPGAYTKHFADGVRQRYMKPIAFFFVGNVIFFLFPFFGNTFSTLLVHQKTQFGYGGIVRSTVDRQLTKKSVSYEEFEKAYNAQSFNTTKTILVLIIPIFAFFIFLVNFSKSGYLSDHLLLSAEFMSFLIFVDMLILPLIIFPIYLLFKNVFGLEIPLGDSVMSTIIVFTLLYFLIRAERKLYDLRWWKAIGKGALLIGFFYITLQTYRFMLFFVTIWTM